MPTFSSVVKLRMSIKGLAAKAKKNLAGGPKHTSSPATTAPNSATSATFDGIDPANSSTSPPENKPVPNKEVPTNPQDVRSDEEWAALKAALQGMGAHSSLASIAAELGQSVDCIPKGDRRREEYTAIASSLKEVIISFQQNLEGLDSVASTGAFLNLVNASHEKADQIYTKQQQRTLEEYVATAQDGGDVIERFRHIETYFRQLGMNIVLNKVDDETAKKQLSRLSPALPATYSPDTSTVVHRRQCAPNTRVSVLAGIKEWADASDGPKVYWLSGMAGTGKTTIAYSVCEMLGNTSQISASFFCSRQLPDCRDVNRVFTTISSQLAQYSGPFRSALFEIMEKEVDRDVGIYGLAFQFEHFIKKPLLAAKESMPGNIVVVIDALDELANERDGRMVLDVLFRSITDLPIKFLITGRPDPSVREPMMTRNEEARVIFNMDDIDSELTRADIETFLTQELWSIATADQIRQLAEQSGSLFIYAATAVRYIMPEGSI